MTQAPMPTRIHRGDSEIVITWPDHESRYAARYLRLRCECAQCREEMTGRPLLDPGTVPGDLRAGAVRLVGNYAVRFDWSDGHDTGIYTYEYLRKICPCGQCAGGDAGGR